MKLPRALKITEVGPRDGFQMESAPIPTELKVETIDRLGRAGVAEIEATSFAHPRVVPQLADAAEVLGAIERVEGVRYTALVPNQRGAERAIAAGAQALRLVVCATETYNRRNAGRGTAQLLEEAGAIARQARAAGVVFCAVVSVATGCPFEGPVPEQRVRELLRALIDAGAEELSLADSAGLGDPAQIDSLSRLALAECGELPFSLHLHDTRGLGLANALAGMLAGVDRFDSAFGGLGGCPVNPGASGNIATEDLVAMCQALGIDCGARLEDLREVSRRLGRHLGRELPARCLAVETRDELFARIEGAVDSGA